MPDNKLDVKTEMLQMKKNWASLERETSNVNTNVKNLMRAQVQPYSYSGQIDPPATTMPERLDQSNEKFNPEDDRALNPKTKYERTLE